MPNVEALLATVQFLWAGHVIQMGDERLVGGQRLRYKDILT